MTDHDGQCTRRIKQTRIYSLIDRPTTYNKNNMKQILIISILAKNRPDDCQQWNCDLKQVNFEISLKTE